MMIYFNHLGCGLLVFGALCGAWVAGSAGQIWGWVTGGIILGLADLAMRCRQLAQPARQRQPFWLVAPCAGGHISFIPIWVWGIVAGVVAVADSSMRPPRPPTPPQELNAKKVEKPKEVWQAAGDFTLRLVPGAGKESDIYLTNHSQDLHDLAIDVAVQRSGGGYGTRIPWKDWQKGAEYKLHTTMPPDVTEFTMTGKAVGANGSVEVRWRWTPGNHPK